MRVRQPFFVLGLALMLLLGCERLSAHPEGRDDSVRYQLPPGTVELLERADAMEVLALGEWSDDGASTEPSVYGRPVVGRASVPYDEQPRVARALYRAMGDAYGVMLCFDPHHAIRLRRGREILEIVICFHCLQMTVGAGSERFLAIAPGPLRPVLDELLEREAGLRFVYDASPHARWVTIEEAVRLECERNGDCVRGERSVEPEETVGGR
jgi:hypothetical protein